MANCNSKGSTSKFRWFLMSVAKQTGGWDIWLGKKWGWEYDEPELGVGGHWHFNSYPYIRYRKEY